MADVMQVNSIRFHICLYFLTLSIFESSSFFSLFLLKIHSLHIIATGFPLCFCCPLKVERNLRRFARPRQKLQKSSSATSDLVQWTAIWTLYINGEKLYYWLEVVPQSDCCHPCPSLQHPCHPCPSVHQAARSLVMQECQRTAAAVWESNRRECSCLVQGCSLCKHCVQAVPIIQRNLNLHHQHLR